MVNDKAKEVTYHETNLLNYNKVVKLVGSYLHSEFQNFTFYEGFSTR